METTIELRSNKSSRGQTTRMFDNNLLERFSRIHPVTPFVFWLPVVGAILYRSATRHDVHPVAMAGLSIAGMFAWTLAEYALHRWVFHWTNGTTLGKRIHFLLHGVHHDFPNDKDRLVMPLAASLPLSVFFYAVFFVTMGGVRTAEPFFAGFTLGYLLYDGTHYAIHHFRPRSRWGKLLRRHHMVHHYADHEGGFGVSTPLWDLVWRTMPSKKR